MGKILSGATASGRRNLKALKAAHDEALALYAEEGEDLSEEELAEVKSKVEAYLGEKALHDEMTNLGRAMKGVEDSLNPSAGGWAALAKGIDLPAGKRTASAPLASLLGTTKPKASLDGGGAGGAFDPAGFTRQHGVTSGYGVDRRFLYPHLVSQPLAEGILSVTAWRQTGTETVTGEIERDPTSVEQKAELDLKLDAVDERVKQFALIISGVPNAMITSEPTLTSFLQTRANAMLAKTLDEYIVATILAATPPPPNVGTGTDLIKRLRTGKAEMANAGAYPTLAALSPDDAAALDLDQRPADGPFTFPLGVSGGSSPLFGMETVEATAVDEPLLIDPALLGTLYMGGSRLEVDSSGSEWKANASSVRVEFEALFDLHQSSGAGIASGA